MRAVDLFSGAGGASLGLHGAGLNLVLAVDSWKLALDTHRLNLPDCETMEADIGTLDPSTLPRADFLWGSPPCPDFSVANAKRNPTRGLVLVRKFLDVVEAVRPKWWVMENVPGVLDYLPANGWRTALFDAADYGVPQHRRRAFVGRYIAPRPTHGPAWQGTLDGDELKPWVTVRQALGLGGGVLPYVHRRDWHNEPKQPRPTDEPAYAMDMAGLMVLDGLNAGGARSVDSPSYTIRAGGTQHRLGAGRNRHPPSEPDMPARTMTAHNTRGGMNLAHNSGQGGFYATVVDPDAPSETITDVGRHDAKEPLPNHRRLTVEECAILQGFPPEFIFVGSQTARYKQVGNAVPPPMARAIAQATVAAARAARPPEAGKA